MPNTMPQNVFNDTAYNIATGNSLTKTLNKAEYDALTAEEVYELVWEPLEMLSPEALCEHIEQIVWNIIDAFEYIVVHNKD